MTSAHSLRLLASCFTCYWGDLGHHYNFAKELDWVHVVTAGQGQGRHGQSLGGGKMNARAHVPRLADVRLD